MEIINLMDTYVKTCKYSKLIINIQNKTIKTFYKLPESSIIITKNKLKNELLYYKYEKSSDNSVIIDLSKKHNLLNKFLILIDEDVDFCNRLESILEKEILANGGS